MGPVGQASSLWLAEACVWGFFCSPHQEYSFLPSHIHIWVQFKSCFQGAFLGVPSAVPCLSPASSAETGSERGVVCMWGMARHHDLTWVPPSPLCSGAEPAAPKGYRGCLLPMVMAPCHTSSQPLTRLFLRKASQVWISASVCVVSYPRLHTASILPLPLVAFGPPAPLLLLPLLGGGLIYKFNFVTIHPCESTIYAYYSSLLSSLCHELKCQLTTMATRSTSRRGCG